MQQGVTGPPDALTEVRRRLVEQELLALGVGQSDPLLMFDRVVDQFCNFMWQAPHENRVPPSGALLLSHPFEDYAFGDCEHFAVDPKDGDSHWRLADGVRSFVAMDGRREVVVMFRAPITDELGLFTLRDDVLFKVPAESPSAPPSRECVVIKRDSSASRCWLTLLAREKIVTYARGRFVGKHYQYALLKALRDVCNPFPWQGASEQQALRSTLRVATHILSPQGVGGTLVLLAPDDADRVNKIEQDELTLKSSHKLGPVSVRNRAHQHSIAHAIAQTDGAAIVDHCGAVRLIGAFFASLRGAPSKDHQLRHAGSRHESAQAFSDKVSGIVVVVSADGPVSVFYRGGLVAVEDPA